MRKSPQSTRRWARRSIRAKESCRLTLLVITASIACTLFSSSAAIASSMVFLKSSPNAPSAAVTNSHATGGQYTTVPTMHAEAMIVAPKPMHS